MTTTTPTRPVPGQEAARATALVWIDAREAVIVRWADGEPSFERHTSDVPTHRKSTGHVRHDSTMRHGGGGAPQSADEPHRLEHLARFVDEAARCLADAEEIVVIGPGTVHEHLAGRLREIDDRQGRTRSIKTVPSARLTDRQLAARLRELVGMPSPRRTVGAYHQEEPT